MGSENKEKSGTGTLFVVATPIGNLGDLSPRAVEILETVDLIACEDTRHTRKLLTHFSIQIPTTSYHEHNEDSKAKLLLERLLKGQTLALVSDAGTPLFSDPGYRLVRSCRQNGIRVLSIPGPFAGAAACSVSGLPTDEVLFVGFLPERAAAKRTKLAHLATIQSTLVIYLAPHGLLENFKQISDVFGDREAFIVREMTKIHETSCWGSLTSIAIEIAAEKPRGEYTLVVRGADEPVTKKMKIDDFDVEVYVEGLIQQRGLSKKEAIKRASVQLGIPKRKVYEVLFRSP